MALHQRLRVGERRVGRDRDRVDHHAAFVALDRAHRRHLFLDRQIAVEHADTAQLRHHDRHVGLGHRVHRGGQDGDVERNLARHLRPRVGHARQHLGFGGQEEHVVEGKAEANFHG